MGGSHQRQINRKRRSAGFSALAAVIIVVVVGIIVVAGVIVAGSNFGGGDGTAGLVPLEDPEKGKVKTQPEDTAPDAAPAGFRTYNNPKLGFSFAYPEAWGELHESADPAAVLTATTDKVAAYSLTDALQVQVVSAAAFTQQINDLKVTVKPQVNNSGGYQWIVADRGTDKRLQPGKPYSPQPPTVYRSGKAQVYGFLLSQSNCTTDTWAFAAADNFVRLRLPAFCISDKPADADIQAGHKTQFADEKNKIMQSITVY